MNICGGMGVQRASGAELCACDVQLKAVRLLKAADVIMYDDLGAEVIQPDFSVAPNARL